MPSGHVLVAIDDETRIRRGANYEVRRPRLLLPEHHGTSELERDSKETGGPTNPQRNCGPAFFVIPITAGHSCRR